MLNANRFLSVWGSLFIGLLFVAPHIALAAEGPGGALPYESWLAGLRASITGPVAFSLALIGIVGSGGVLIFGGELNGFLRTLLFIVLVMALIIGAQNMLSGFFGRGAELAQIIQTFQMRA
jgi:type IV secretion system protein TrbC